MKKFIKLLSLFAILFSVSSCDLINSIIGGKDDPNEEHKLPEWHDYVSDLKLDTNDGKNWMEVTVKQYVDGDTTHFNVTDSKYVSSFENATLKARYLGIDTPESTGQVQPYGKKASNFTHDHLASAESIIVQSEDGNWNYDSTGARTLAWVWYKPVGGDYKLLNLELLQEGYTAAKNYSSLTYGQYFSDAYTQALAYGLRCVGTTPDPDYHYGSAVQLTLKELRIHAANYNGVKVRFECTIARVNGTTAYVYDYDEMSQQVFGFQVFMGYVTYPPIEVGNRVSLCGTCTYYETGKTYQVSGLSYNRMRVWEDDTFVIKDDAGNKMTGLEIDYSLITAADLNPSTKVNITYLEYEEGQEEGVVKTESVTKPYVLTHTPVSMENIEVTKVYTTKSGSSTGAMTLTCKTSDNKEVTVRTIVLKDASGNVITADAYNGKTISVKGIVDFYSNDEGATTDTDAYQIRVLSPDDIIVK